MKAELLKRLFRAIADDNDKGLRQLALVIIEDERQKGHQALANQLEEVFAKAVKRPLKLLPTVTPSIEKSLSGLPVSRRDQQLLATLVPQDALRHHMVLSQPVEERFVRIEKEYTARERLAKFGLKPRRKIMLYGPPGCGKTLGAERLAWNTGLPLVKVRFDCVLSSFFGESAANLRAVFEASQKQPCLLLLDECDFIARSRTTNQDVGEAPRIVNMLLQLLEEYELPGLLVATTNLDSALDNALFRRFDDVFEVPRPTAVEIGNLLKMTLSAMKVVEGIDWQRLTEQLTGYSAANVVMAAQNAAKYCVLAGEDVVQLTHLQKAISEIRKTD